MNVIELFCGKGVISKAFRDRGHKVFSVDIRKRKGVCEPDLRKNVLQLVRKDIPFKHIHVVWASPPCDVWSYAGGSFHWNKDNSPKTDKCKLHIKLLKKTLETIQALSPDYFFIENPRGRLRYNKLMIDFLVKSQGLIKQFTMSSYGFPTKKPTDIFTNAYDLRLKHLDSFGRGAKNDPGVIFNNFTKCQIQKLPRCLAEDIVIYCEKKLKLR